MRDYKIPLTILAKMTGISRQTLWRIKKTGKCSEAISGRLEVFDKRWSLDKEKNLYHLDPFFSPGPRTRVSSTGYSYELPELVDDPLPSRCGRTNAKIPTILMLSRYEKEAMDYHKEKIKVPKYTMWETCVCGFKVMTRPTLPIKKCPDCGKLMSRCRSCVFEFADCGTSCNFRKKRGGFDCPNCSAVISKNLPVCPCGWIVGDFSENVKRGLA